MGSFYRPSFGFCTLDETPIVLRLFNLAGILVEHDCPLLIALGGILKKCVNSQAVYPLSEQHGLKARERRYTAHEEGKHWE